MKVDLHVHTNNSDGEYSVEEILKFCESCNIKILSITDHDSVDGYLKLSKNFKSVFSGEIISGVELSFRHNGRLFDVLGYNVDINIMNDWINKRYSKENQINKQKIILKEMIKLYKDLGFKFNDNISISTGLKSEAYNKVILTLKENKENLKLEKELDKSNFYKKHHTNPMSKYYIDETMGLPTLREAVDIIKKAGGVSVLAHSCAYGFSSKELDEFVVNSIDCGVDGIELKYPAHTKLDEIKLLKYCKEYNLFATCGSDFHGENIKKCIKLGVGYKNYEFSIVDIKDFMLKIKK